MSSPPFNWTRSSRPDQCTSLLAGGSAPVVPLSLLLSPSKPNRATNRQAHNLRGTCSKLHAAQLGPSQLWLRPPPPKPSFLNAASLFKLPSVYTDYSLTLECSHHTLPFQSSSSASFFLLGTHTKCHRTQEALWVEPGEPSLGTCSDGTLYSNISICLPPSFSLDHQIPGGRWPLRHLQTQLRVRHTKGISRPTQLPKET